MLLLDGTEKRPRFFQVSEENHYLRINFNQPAYDVIRRARRVRVPSQGQCHADTDATARRRQLQLFGGVLAVVAFRVDNRHVDPVEV